MCSMKATAPAGSWMRERVYPAPGKGSPFEQGLPFEDAENLAVELHPDAVGIADVEAVLDPATPTSSTGANTAQTARS